MIDIEWENSHLHRFAHKINTFSRPAQQDLKKMWFHPMWNHISMIVNQLTDHLRMMAITSLMSLML